MGKLILEPTFYFGDSTPENKMANDLMTKLEFSGLLSDKLLKFFYKSFLNMFECISKKDVDGGIEIYREVEGFLDMYTIFSNDFKITVRSPFMYLLNSINR